MKVIGICLSLLAGLLTYGELTRSFADPEWEAFAGTDEPSPKLVRLFGSAVSSVRHDVENFVDDGGICASKPNHHAVRFLAPLDAAVSYDPSERVHCVADR